MNESKVMERIRKLLALANSSNEHEAAAAAAAAARLLAEHDLAEAEVRAADPAAPAPEDPIIERFPLWERGQEPANRSHWRMRCAEAVAADLGVRTYWSGSQINAFGRSSAVAAWRYTTEWLIGVVDRLASEVQSPYSWESTRTYRAAWRLGCAERIRERAREGERARAAASAAASAVVAPGTALAVVARNAQEVADAYRRYSAKFGTCRGPSVSGSGYQAGRQAGDGVGLNRGLASGAKRLK